MPDDNSAIIHEAVNAVGRDDPEDWRIQPTAFPKVLQKNAPEIAAIADHSSLTECARRYEDYDQDAVDAQSQFKKLSAISSWCIFAGTATAALLASLTTVLSDDPSAVMRVVVFLLGLCCLGSGSLATALLYRITHEKLLQKWMSSRATAEIERLGYFNRLVRRSVDTGSGKPVLLLQCLEVVRRYQLAVQQLYYKGRGDQHLLSRRKTVAIGAISAVILGVGSGGIAIGASFDTRILPIVAIGTIGAALSMIASRREELRQDERNAERYDRTYKFLSNLRERHSDVQEAVAAGDASVLLKYVNAIHEQLSLEHRQWITDTEAMSSTINELVTSLENKTG